MILGIVMGIFRQSTIDASKVYGFFNFVIYVDLQIFVSTFKVLENLRFGCKFPEGMNTLQVTWRITLDKSWKKEMWLGLNDAFACGVRI